jgi:uncharacterized repeat protein (TIGR02543 family)
MSKKLLVSAFCALISFSTAFAEFDPCKFNFGTDWDYLGGNQGSGVASSVTYVTKWIVNTTFDGNKVYGDFCNYCKSNNKTPVFYGYIIAKAAALGDANVGGKLGTEGAGWLKNNITTVVNDYKAFAERVASTYGTDKTVIWLMEPDYYQYFDVEKQNVKLTFQDAGQWMGQMIDAVKTSLPKAQFAVDISPWIEWKSGRTEQYYGAFPMSKIDFMFTSGGIALANNDKIKIEDPMTWSGIYNTTKKSIIADCGYGAGGGCTGHNAAWDDVNNLKARIANGVCAITQKCPNGNWGTTISSLNSSLANVEVKSCNGTTPTNFTLTINAGTGGTVTKDPNSNSYASGTKVKLTATASTGYVFKSWSGDASGTNASIEINMDGNKTVTAVFEQKAAETFTLTVNAGNGGTVTKNPNNGPYASGTKVTLTAVPSEGYVFKNWSGAVSGTNATVEITMDGNKTVSAVFEQKPANTAVLTVKVVGTGSVAKSPDKSSYDKGSTITLTAKPSSGVSVFDGWSGGGLSGKDLSATITLNSDITVTATFRDTGKVDSIHVEAENFTEKSGDKITAETSNGITSIGWIEKGNSTTYKVNVSKAGTYALAFRVGTGLDRTEFTVTIDGTSAGTISFAGTTGNWSEFHYENLQKTVELTAGEHTIKLSYGDAMNVDKFVLIIKAGTPVVFEKDNRLLRSERFQFITTISGFTAQLPDKHGYTTYSLFDCKGKLISKGTINAMARQLTFSNLSKDLWILRLEGKVGTVSLRTAVVR